MARRADFLRDLSASAREFAIYWQIFGGVGVPVSKGLDGGDVVMRKVIGSKLIHSLRIREKQGQLVLEGKRKGVSVWKLPEVKTLI